MKSENFFLCTKISSHGPGNIRIYRYLKFLMVNIISPNLAYKNEKVDFFGNFNDCTLNNSASMTDKIMYDTWKLSARWDLSESAIKFNDIKISAQLDFCMCPLMYIGIDDSNTCKLKLNYFCQTMR